MREAMHFSKVLVIVVSIFFTGFFFEYSPYGSMILESLEMITELFTVFVSFSIFSITWYSYNKSKDNNALFLGAVFFVIGILDLFHTLSYPFMPEFITPNSLQKSSFFWIAARSISAPLLLVSAYIYRDTLSEFINKSVMSVSVFLVTFVSLITVLFFDALVELPDYLFYSEDSIFVIRIFLVPITALFILYASYLYIKRIKETGQNNLIYLVFGFIIIMLSDTIYFTYEISAHLLKLIAFYFVFIALYKSSVEFPYEMLVVVEEKLRHAVEEKYRNLFDNASDAIITIDPEDRITSWNMGAENIFGWTASEAVGKELVNLIVPPYLISERKTIIGYVIAGGVVSGFDTVRMGKGGNEINVGVTISPLRDTNNNITGISAIIRDITERKRTEEELRKYHDHLEELVDMRTAELTEANEKLKKEIVEREKAEEKIAAQNEFKTIIANLLPLLMENIPSDKKTEVIWQMSKQVEEVIWTKYINDSPSDLEQIASRSCNIMELLGGDFTIEKADKRSFTVKNKICPWGDHDNLNPVLCMLTKAIFSRTGVRLYKNINVDIKKTIAGGDGYCLIEAYTGES